VAAGALDGRREECERPIARTVTAIAPGRCGCSMSLSAAHHPPTRAESGDDDRPTTAPLQTVPIDRCRVAAPAHERADSDERQDGRLGGDGAGRQRRDPLSDPEADRDACHEHHDRDVAPRRRHERPVRQADPDDAQERRQEADRETLRDVHEVVRRRVGGVDERDHADECGDSRVGEPEPPEPAAADGGDRDCEPDDDQKDRDDVRHPRRS
jgi:hypothetical protein